MNKKIIAIISALLIVGLLYFGYNTFFAPKGVEGVKAVSVQVVIEDKDINETFTYETEHEFLFDLLVENEEELGITFEKFDFGSMITGMMDYIADQSNNEYFHVTINGEDAMSGPEEIPLNNEDVYTFELTTW